MTDIQISVMPALRLRGSLNAGMPFEIASTPVSAVVPRGEGVQDEEQPTLLRRLDVHRRRLRHRVQRARRAARTSAMPTVSTIMATKK